MSAYYNDNDPYACAWLRNLIKAGLIDAGEVDERSVAEVRAGDLAGFAQCHFFAGLGGWAYAMRLAGWPAERELWTGSCPCQPFSRAGRQVGEKDQRHLWPEFFRLICECRPAVVAGEQVAGGKAVPWFARVSADLEGEGYAVTPPLVLPACSVGAPHLRYRQWFVADAGGDGVWLEPRRRCGANGSGAPLQLGRY